MQRITGAFSGAWIWSRRFRSLGFLECFGPGLNACLALVVAAILGIVITFAFPFGDYVPGESSPPALDQIIGQAVARYGLLAVALTTLGSILRAAAHQQRARVRVDQLGKLLAVVSGALLLWGALVVTAQFRSIMDFLSPADTIAKFAVVVLSIMLIILLVAVSRERRSRRAVES